MWRISTLFRVVYIHSTHAGNLWRSSNTKCISVSRVYSVNGWRHCVSHWTDLNCKPVVQRPLWQCYGVSAYFVAVSDDSVSDEATSPSVVTISVTRLLHFSRMGRSLWGPCTWSTIGETNTAENIYALNSVISVVIFNVRQSYCARYWYRLDACPSVCPSHACIVSKRLNISSLSSLPGSPVTLVFWGPNFSQWEHPQWGH